MSLKERLIKNSNSKLTTTLNKSKIFNDKSWSRTKVPIINIALSGSVDKGGLQSGLTVLAGPSKHFKSNLGLTLVSAYLDAHEDAVCLFYDSEFGITDSYMQAMGVDPERVVHTPIKDLEELKTDMMNQLDNIERGDKVIIFIDSLGNTGSRKEAEDAIKGESKVDFTRAKEMKSLWRIATPHFTLKDIPCVAINHTIETIEMFSKTVMTGGTGIMYSADNVIIIGRRQIKEGTEISGYQFVLNAEKSRMVREKSKFFLNVTFDGGIDRFSGLLDIGLELGFVVKPKNGWYKQAFLDEETGEFVVNEEGKMYRERQTQSSDPEAIDFWKPLLQHKPFLDAIEKRYKVAEIVSDNDLDKEVELLLG